MKSGLCSIKPSLFCNAYKFFAPIQLHLFMLCCHFKIGGSGDRSLLHCRMLLMSLNSFPISRDHCCCLVCSYLLAILLSLRILHLKIAVEWINQNVVVISVIDVTSSIDMIIFFLIYLFLRHMHNLQFLQFSSSRIYRFTCKNLVFRYLYDLINLNDFYIFLLMMYLYKSIINFTINEKKSSKI